MTVIKRRQAFYTRLGLTDFDALVFSVAAVLIVVITLSVFFLIERRGVQVAYLRLSESGGYEVFVAEPDDPGSARQVTNTEFGIDSFDTSADGRYIAYAMRDFETGASDIYLYDLETEQTTRLTNCSDSDADCNSPAFRPSGELIAYQRMELNSTLGTGVGSNRIWLIDMRQGTTVTYPLFEDSQILGYDPTWSPDGSKLAFYDTVNAGILVYDFNTTAGGEAALQLIPSDFGVVGSLSPEGRRMAFTDMLFDGPQTRGYVQIADLESNIFEPLTDPNEPVDDQFTAWNPNGNYIAMGRIYRDERFTRGAQVYLYNLETGTLNPLIVDEAFANGFLTWSPDGNLLAIQRFQQLDENGEPFVGGTTEVWTYNLETRALTKISENARNPIWLP